MNCSVLVSNLQGPIESANHLPVILRRTMGKKMYEIVNAKLSEGTKVGLFNTSVRLIE